MSIDVRKLRELLANGSVRPWEQHCEYRDEMLSRQADGSVLQLGIITHEPNATLAAEAVNALGPLLDVFEAVCAYVDREGPLLEHDRKRDPFCVVIDAARGMTALEAVRAAIRTLDEQERVGREEGSDA